MFLHLLAGEVAALGVEDFAAAFYHLALALAAAALAAAGGGEVDALFGKRGKEVAALLNAHVVFAVDADIYLAARRQVLLGHEQEDDQEEYHYQEYSYTGKNEIKVH